VKRRRALHALGAAGALATLLSGCTGPRLAAAPERATDLAGRWLLTPESQADAERALLTAVPPRREARSTAQRGAAPGDATTAPTGDEGGRRGGGRTQGGGRGGSRDSQSSRGARSTAADFATSPVGGRDPAAFLRALVLPVPYLEFAQSRELVAIVRSGARRAFDPGGEAPVGIVDAFGARNVRAGWQGADFVVLSSGAGAQLAIEERYRLGADGNTLLVNVKFSGGGVPSLRLAARYARATEAQFQPATSDGPPTRDGR
jgi:hypothetical protein